MQQRSENLIIFWSGVELCGMDCGLWLELTKVDFLNIPEIDNYTEGFREIHEK